MTYAKCITISKEKAKFINYALTHEPKCKEDMVMGEDSTIVNYVNFPNGYSMDIKCCGVKFDPSTSNTAWTEAVLFDENGVEVACSDAEEQYTGKWELKDDDTTYIVDVMVA